jgi:hypothetical protein
VKTKLSIALLLVLVTSAPCYAIAILGTMSCGDWVQARRQPGPIKDAYSFWVLGFLSGSVVQTKQDVLRGVGPNAIETWVDNYCQQNPLDLLGAAAASLFEELGSRQRR